VADSARSHLVSAKNERGCLSLACVHNSLGDRGRGGHEVNLILVAC
jgi:hypothetical protein